jgi:hypothetical protein
MNSEIQTQALPTPALLLRSGDRKRAKIARCSVQHGVNANKLEKERQL